DLEYPISISFEESLRGRRTVISLRRKHRCETCHGSGQAPGTRESVCPNCAGGGKAIRTKGHLQFAVTCSECGGTGRSITACTDCGGEGRIAATGTEDVELPAGVMTGSRVSLPGKGDAGSLGAPSGDLYVVISVADHP